MDAHDALGAQERALFEGEATTLFEALLSEETIPVDDPRIAPDGPAHQAFDLLHRLGLVIHSPDRLGWMAVDPATVQAQTVAPMGQQGAELLAESAGWASAFGNLAHSWRRSPQSARGPFTELHWEAIGPFIASVVADAEEEIITAQPQAGRDAKQLSAALDRDFAALNRGVRMRTLYQHSARRSTETRRYVAAVTAAGGEVRTLDEFFNRLIVVDRRIAIIPGAEGPSTAVAIREVSTVDYLVDVFNRSWERGRRFANREDSISRGIAAEQRAMTIRMLIEGRSDPVGAKRLGVSPRTYAGYVADLKNEFESETRFQLGYEMGRRGISGTEVHDEGNG